MYVHFCFYIFVFQNVRFVNELTNPLQIRIKISRNKHFFSRRCHFGFHCTKSYLYMRNSIFFSKKWFTLFTRKPFLNSGNENSQNRNRFRGFLNRNKQKDFERVEIFKWNLHLTDSLNDLFHKNTNVEIVIYWHFISFYNGRLLLSTGHFNK